jgi:hypothetical protein
MRRPLCTIYAVILMARVANASDPLPSWNETAPRQAIVAFVEKVTNQGSSDFVPMAERIAVFDNDGTIWPENPVRFQLSNALDTLTKDIAVKPELKQAQMVEAPLNRDLATLLAGAHHVGLLPSGGTGSRHVK